MEAPDRTSTAPFSGGYWCETKNLVFTPEEPGRRPRSDYPSDEAALCRKLNSRLYIVVESSVQEMIGLTVIIDPTLTESWKRGHDRTDALRVKVCRDGILSVRDKEAKDFVRKVLGESNDAKHHILGDPPNLPKLDELIWALAQSDAHPFAAWHSYASKQLGVAVATIRRGGRESIYESKLRRRMAATAADMPNFLAALSEVAAKVMAELGREPEISAELYAQTTAMEEDFLNLGKALGKFERLTSLNHLKAANILLNPHREERWDDDGERAVTLLKRSLNTLVP